MNILIVDGNEKKASDNYIKAHMPTQYEIYKQVLVNLSKVKLNITTIHPACVSEYMPEGVNLDDFVGIVWTGSTLNLYDYGPSIERQIELAKNLLNKKNKVFGSCWGLQVLATAAGGSIRKNPKGLEAVIASEITLNAKGINHPMYKNKPNKFDSFCYHYDEVEKLPNNTIILSSNRKSKVQSFSFHNNNSEVWAVQYHPEFNARWIAGLMTQRKKVLLEENIFTTTKRFEKLNLYLSNIKKFENLKKELSISNSLVTESTHTMELSNWLENLRNNV